MEIRLRAFAYFLSQQDMRSYSGVAKKFKLTSTTVSKWAKEDEWETRAKQFDQNVSNAIPALAEEAVLDARESIKLLCVEAITRWKENLRVGAIKLDSAKDLALLVKTWLLVSGEATAIVQNIGEAQKKAHEILSITGDEDDDAGQDSFN